MPTTHAAVTQMVRVEECANGGRQTKTDLCYANKLEEVAVLQYVINACRLEQIVGEPRPHAVVQVAVLCTRKDAVLDGCG